MFVFNDYQVDSLVLEEFISNEQFAIVLTDPKPKWLNIILDINGILCHCIEKKATNKIPFVNSVHQQIHSSIAPIIIGPKGVFTRPSLVDFLTTISKFVARVIIWSSMKRSTVQEIVHYFFHGLPPLYEVLG